EGDIGTLSLHVSMNPGEYSYFSPRTLSMWAGPEHWRFRPRHPRESRGIPEFRAGKGSDPRILGWEGLRSWNSGELFPAQNLSSPNPGNVLGCSSGLASAQTLLEGPKGDEGTRPRLFPGILWNVFPQLSRSSDPVGTLDNEAGIEDYDYDNPNDTSNFCPALQVQPRNSLLGITLGKSMAREFLRGRNWSCRALQADSLPQIHKIPIQYAKTAKKMDMRRLKRNMWELLTEQGTAGEIPGEELSFSQSLLLWIPGCSGIPRALIPFFHRLPPAMATNLSVPLAFVCLLHLANEKNLKLESTEDLSDILVK
ncbi:CND2 protein, partial [Leiothrix lutea]|nr:CND2 protein [Leiothrix lutea]